MISFDVRMTLNINIKVKRISLIKTQLTSNGATQIEVLCYACSLGSEDYCPNSQ